ncbi:MAG: hypothetical protein Q9213_003286 [Squamulea squamosa]
MNLSTTRSYDVFSFGAILVEAHLASKVTKPVSDVSHTISQDLAGGKTAQKDRDLRLLLRGAASSTVEDRDLLREAASSIDESRDYWSRLWSLVWLRRDDSSTVAAKPFGESSRHEDTAWSSGEDREFESASRFSMIEADSIHSSLRIGMETSLIAQPHLKEKRMVGEGKANTEPGCSRYRKLSQSFEQQYSEQVQIVYLIHCHDDAFRHHTALAYLDPPSRTHVSGEPDPPRQRESEHLNGRTPIANLALFMETEKDDTAIVLVRHVKCAENVYVGFEFDQELNYTETLAIRSAVLRAAVAAVARCYYNQPQPPDTHQKDSQLVHIEQFSVTPANLFLYHHSSLLEEYMCNHPEAAKHIKVLLAYCDHKYGQDFAAATQLFSMGRVSQKHLDKLFMPNTPVLVKGAGSGDADVTCVLYTWPQFSSEGNMSIDCWFWQHDGKRFVRRDDTWQMNPISRPTVTIQSLSIYPLFFAPEEIKKTLELRGRKHWSYRNSCHVSYTGWNVSHDEYYPGSRFMIDYKVYRKMHERGPAFTFRTAPTPRRYDTWPSELQLHQDPSPTDYMLMPADMYGFYLTEKQWIHILVDGVQSIQWNKSAYERLVLPLATKELVRALVTVRTSQHGVKHGLGSTGKRIDIIAGKGNGLIMLLHGGPGTGKSLTAESVAEIAEMPLYRVTCGDIGVTPAEVEKYLASVMYLGTTWNCVLLLDEADVFLEERSMSDLARNSLVSVFLRTLEYYDGILILTSNRVGIFDEAFKSRIQVALHYPNLTRPSRKKIWINFIEMLEEDDEDVNFDELYLHMDELAACNMNGRQIRNTITTARELAMFKVERLDWKHIQQALKVSIDFSNYLHNMHGHTDDENARDKQIR